VVGPLPDFGVFTVRGRKFKLIYWPRARRRRDLLAAVGAEYESELKTRLRSLYWQTHPDRGGDRRDFEQVQAIKRLLDAREGGDVGGR
jgi:hypothetical protein